MQAQAELCPHRPPCPGCPRWGERGIPLAAAERLAALAREARLAPPEVVEGSAFGFRHRARLAVRGRAASPKIGIFQAGSHRIADIPRCRVHHPLVNRVAAAARAALRATGTPPYAERAHRGALRSLQVVVERASQSAQVVLVGNARDPAALSPLAAALRAELGGALHSLWWNGNPERTNTILGPLWERWCGPETVCERIAGARVHFPPGAFGQSNPPLADAIAARIAGWIPAGARVAEYYAGCGALGLGLAARGHALVLNESNGHALRGLALGREALPAAARARVRIAPGPAGAAAALAGEADVVIADPPRKGLDAELLAALRARPPARLVYLSCDLERFLAQARELLAGGRLRLAELVVYALFPHTDHVETLARFDYA
jgi:tRNA/tmRNA/rRNA uracil-C5-methylase (TrmA/RlmC/RlmD family)